MASSTNLYVLIYLGFFQEVVSLGTGKIDNADTVGFVKEDNQRDTISLLISCLATLGLCVYSAVHLNIPRKAEQNYWTLLRELKWCVIGLFAPELILYTAWRQLASAKQLCFEIEQARSNEDRISMKDIDPSVSQRTPSAPTLSTPWSVAHGFYGTMGGFAFDLDDADDRYKRSFGCNKRLTLTAEGVALLAQCGHIPDISLDDIKDKNKADGLAKLLVCIQAGWMMIQVISRTATGLPTSLLEVHTVAHVVCALIMYALWWHKPRQVESPTILKDNSALPLIAYMYLASRISGETPPGAFGRFQNAVPEIKSLAYFEAGDTVDQTHLSIRRFDTAQTVTVGRLDLLPVSEISSKAQEPRSPMPRDEIKLERIQLASEAVNRYPVLRSKFKRLADESNRRCPAYSIPQVTEFLQPYAFDWPNDGLLRRTQSLVMGMVLWGASMAYGAIHVAAWDYFFPTTLERLFWHLSSVWVTFCAAFWLLTNFLAHFFPFIDRLWVAYNERRLGFLSSAVITTLCILCGVSYIVSRAYLVVEAFLSIRKVPKDVYQTPSWSQIFPHL